MQARPGWRPHHFENPHRRPRSESLRRLCHVFFSAERASRPAVPGSLTPHHRARPPAKAAPALRRSGPASSAARAKGRKAKNLGNSIWLSSPPQPTFTAPLEPSISRLQRENSMPQHCRSPKRAASETAEIRARPARERFDESAPGKSAKLPRGF